MTERQRQRAPTDRPLVWRDPGSRATLLDVGENNLRDAKDLGFGPLSLQGRFRLDKGPGYLGETHCSGVRPTQVQTRPGISQSDLGCSLSP